MAKLRVTNLKQVRATLRKKLTANLRSKEVRETVGAIVVEDIKNIAYPVTSEATLAWRKYYEQTNPTDSSYRRSMLNTTFTGMLLNDLMTNVRVSLRKGIADFVIAQSNKKHPLYKLKRKKRGAKPRKPRTRQSYSQIGAWVRDAMSTRGYNYLDVKDGTKGKVIAYIKGQLLKKFK